MERAPDAWAARTICADVTGSPGTRSPSRASWGQSGGSFADATSCDSRCLGRRSRGHCEISQFWQNSQRRLQPTVAIEYALDPGYTWNSGFFSIGSRLREMTRSATSVKRVP